MNTETKPQAVAVVERVVMLNNINQARVEREKPMKAVDSVNLKPWEKKSISYARCRAAINTDCNVLFKDNFAGAKNFKKGRKAIVVEFLGGKVEWQGIGNEKKKFVKFADGSQARY